MNPKECQFISLPGIAEGNVQFPSLSLSKRLKIFVRRHVSTDTDRILYRYYNTVMGWYLKSRGFNRPAPELDAFVPSEPLKAGDLVRIRSEEEIGATLNHLGQLRGCSFMSVQAPYCGTVHRVLKSMERFVDERDLRVKKCKGLILLEGVMCEGTTDFGRCDRSCLMFWREEWLEKLDE